MRISASVTLYASVVAPLKVELSIYKKGIFVPWIKLPCLMNLGKLSHLSQQASEYTEEQTHQLVPLSNTGSCTYNNICTRLAAINISPAQLVSLGVPYQCPFSAVRIFDKVNDLPPRSAELCTSCSHDFLPFQNTHSFQDVDFDITRFSSLIANIPAALSGVISGDMKVEVKLSTNGRRLGCTTLLFNVRKN